MRCAWEKLLGILPVRFREEVDRLGRETLQEFRLRLGIPPELVCRDGRKWLRPLVTRDDLSYCMNAASRYSPWNASSVANGYLTAPGGHRLGICGNAVVRDGQAVTIRVVTSLCIRVAREFPGIAGGLESLTGSVLILGPPGSGKTTLLREMLRLWSDGGTHIVVVDERGELFPSGAGFASGRCTDVLSGCPKVSGIGHTLRAMAPDVIAVDEITRREDCEALVQAMYCGVRLVATAHAASGEDLIHRSAYRPLLENGTFTHGIIMNRDKSWRLERMNL